MCLTFSKGTWESRATLIVTRHTRGHARRTKPNQRTPSPSLPGVDRRIVKRRTKASPIIGLFRFSPSGSPPFLVIVRPFASNQEEPNIARQLGIKGSSCACVNLHAGPRAERGEHTVTAVVRTTLLQSQALHTGLSNGFCAHQLGAQPDGHISLLTSTWVSNPQVKSPEFRSSRPAAPEHPRRHALLVPRIHRTGRGPDAAGRTRTQGIDIVFDASIRTGLDRRRRAGSERIQSDVAGAFSFGRERAGRFGCNLPDAGGAGRGKAGV